MNEHPTKSKTMPPAVMASLTGTDKKDPKKKEKSRDKEKTDLSKTSNELFELTAYFLININVLFFFYSSWKIFKYIF